MTIVRVRTTPSARDKYGDPPTGTPVRTTLVGAFTAPRSSSDLTDRGRQGVIVGLSLYAPPGTDLLLTDGIEVDGDPYEIDGEPGTWANPFAGGTMAGLEVALRRAVG